MAEQRIRLRIATPPHSDKQRLIMNAFQIPGLLEMWVACGSKWGKTFAAGCAISTTVPLDQGPCLYRWIAPISSQSAIGMKYCRQIMPPPPYTKVNESASTIYMPHNQSTIQFFHGQYPESLEGEATSGTILDEAAKMKEQVYHSSKTTTGVTKGPIIAISTPRGDNWFKRKCDEAKEEMLRARHEKRRPTKIFIHAPSTDNPKLSPEYLADVRRSMPERLYRQYILAEFTGTGSIFNNLQNCWMTDYIEYEDQFQWLVEGCEVEDVVVGVDWARTTDYTVFTATNPSTREVVGIWRMNGIPYPAQVSRLVNFCKNFGSVLTVWHDKTGVGVALDDMLGHTELPFRGITFTNASKNEMMVKLILAFEEQNLFIPYINKLNSELNDLEVKTTALGLATYAASGSGHDDLVMSLALSHVAMLQHCERDYSITLF